MMVKREAIADVGHWDEGYFALCRLGLALAFSAKGLEDFVCAQCASHKFFRNQCPGVLMGLVALGVWLRFGLVAGYYTVKRMIGRG